MSDTEDLISAFASEPEDDIPRSTTKLSPDMFKKFFELSSKQEWLNKKQEEMNYLIERCPNLESQNLIIDLLYNFVFLTATEILNYVEQIKKYILEEIRPSHNSCIISALHNNNKPDSAPVILQLLRTHMVAEDDWSEDNFVNNIISAVDVAKSGDTIIIVDEFIGTGFQAEGLLKAFQKKSLHSKKTFKETHLCVVARMERSIQKLEPYLTKYYSEIELKRGITDYNSPNEAQSKISLMKTMESSLSEKYSNQTWDSLGKKASETIYASGVGTAPANLFPIFWWKWDKQNKRRKNLLNRG